MVFVYNGPEAAADVRYDYHWRVLRAALDATSPQWGAYEMRASQYMNETRQLIEMQQPSGELNTMVLDATSELEQKLLPVRIPVDKGLLGYRVFLIRANDQSKFDRVQRLDELTRFSIGQGTDWSDVQIFKAAGFNVVTGSSYPGLFGMLAGQRFDAFSRGVSEVLAEVDAFGTKYPTMAIEHGLLLYYPMPLYFWLPRTEEGQTRAKRVEEGMLAIMANGTLDKLFRAEYGDVVKKLNLKNRRLFTIDNPTLANGQPFANKKWLFDPRR